MKLLTKLRAAVIGGIAALVLVGAILHAPPQLIAQGIQLLTTLSGTEQVSLFQPCTVSCGTTTSTLWAYGRATNLLYTTTASASASATTAEQTLGTYSLAANTLITGTKLLIRAAFDSTADTNNKTAKCYFGASVISSGALPINNGNIVCQLVVTRTSANRQTVWGFMIAGVTPITPYINYGTDTDTSAIVIKATATDAGGAVGDLILADFSVERLGR